MGRIHSWRLVAGASLATFLLADFVLLAGDYATTHPLSALLAEMILIPSGEFQMGAADTPNEALCGGGDPTADARPVHRVRVDAFWMDRTEVTNAQFRVFVEATHYVTTAEKPPRQEDFSDAPAAALVPGSLVFTPTVAAVPLDDFSRWWTYRPGADWRHPAGPGSDLVGKDHFPVVHVTYVDAEAYARWAGKRLPTEAEWEYAARGSLSAKPYVWGDELQPDGRWMANIYEGDFPVKDSGADGHVGLAEVAQYPPNGYGLYDMAGNVWEWCADWYRPDYYSRLSAKGEVTVNPAGPDDSFDPAEPGIPKRVQRGGSFLCTAQYCSRYLVGSRGNGDPNTSSNHVGFRCVRDATPRPAATH